MVNALGYGQTLTGVFAVRSLDGTSQLVSITIAGPVDSFAAPSWHLKGDLPYDFSGVVAGGSSATTMSHHVA